MSRLGPGRRQWAVEEAVECTILRRAGVEAVGYTESDSFILLPCVDGLQDEVYRLSFNVARRFSAATIGSTASVMEIATTATIGSTVVSSGDRRSKNFHRK